MPTAELGHSSRPWLLAARAAAVTSVGVVLVLFVTAGELVQNHALEDVHGAAAIVLHVVTGALATTLAGLAHSRGRGWWSAALAGLLFAYTFVQAYLGEGTTLALHIPGSLAVAGAAVWLTAWLFCAVVAE
ncbi:hypothetical protein ACNUDN_21145 [Mycobacterium sp. smrl_JER01]|uniref:hypothetical protein n=1 Tax=Mycobacterium sp. smrl_JER01 TaxID=3402633 RepID=UPI003ABF0B8F